MQNHLALLKKVRTRLGIYRIEKEGVFLFLESEVKVSVLHKIRVEMQETYCLALLKYVYRICACICFAIHIKKHIHG